MTNQSKAIDARQVDNLDDDPDDFDVAYAVARDILDWPVEALRDIQNANAATKRSFLHWIKMKIQQEFAHR